MNYADVFDVSMIGIGFSWLLFGVWGIIKPHNSKMEADYLILYEKAAKRK